MNTLTASSSESTDRSRVIGACVASAAAYLPFHVMALLVALAVRDGRLDVATSGWISATYMLGILLGTTALPLLGISRIPRPWALAVVLIACSALWLGVHAGRAMLLVSWLIVGICSGVLSVLGSLAAAAYHDRHFAYGLRLALVLFSSAGFMLAAQALGRFDSYEQVIAFLSVFFLVTALAGLTRYQPLPLPAPATGGPEARPWPGAELLLVLCFFVAQPGFWAYSAHLAGTHGVPASNLPLVYAASKVLGALALLRWGAHAQAGLPTVWLGSALGLSVVMMAVTGDLLVFGLALVTFEIVVNLQSTRLQASIAERQPRMAGLWMPACVAGGAASGTAVHGAAIDAGLGPVFVLFCVAAGIVPALALCRRPR